MSNSFSSQVPQEKPSSNKNQQAVETPFSQKKAASSQKKPPKPPEPRPRQAKKKKKKQKPQPQAKKTQQPKKSTRPQQTTSGGAKFVKHASGSSLGGIFKLLYILIFLAAFGFGGYFLTTKIFLKNKPATTNEILLQTPYQPVNWKGFGNVFEPKLKIPVVLPERGVKEMDFLLDSGALVSSLPRDFASKLGYDSMAKLQRSTFRGFGGTSSFAYKGEMKVMLGNKKAAIPVVFTEAAGTKKLIGRSGFFENFSIYFNSKKKVIEVRRK